METGQVSGRSRSEWRLTSWGWSARRGGGPGPRTASAGARGAARPCRRRRTSARPSGPPAGARAARPATAGRAPGPTPRPPPRTSARAASPLCLRRGCHLRPTHHFRRPQSAPRASTAPSPPPTRTRAAACERPRADFRSTQTKLCLYCSNVRVATKFWTIKSSSWTLR